MEQRSASAACGHRDGQGGGGAAGTVRGYLAFLQRRRIKAERAKGLIHWFEQEIGFTIITRRRRAEEIYARWLCWMVLRKWGYSSTEIARVFGMDHTTILHGLQRASAYPELVAYAEEIQAAYEADGG